MPEDFNQIFVRAIQGDPQAIMRVGDVVDKATRGAFGKVFKSLINALEDEWVMLSESRERVDASRVLGRIEGTKKLQERLAMCVDDRDRIVGQQKQKYAINTEPEE